MLIYISLVLKVSWSINFAFSKLKIVYFDLICSMLFLPDEQKSCFYNLICKLDFFWRVLKYDVWENKLYIKNTTNNKISCGQENSHTLPFKDNWSMKLISILFSFFDACIRLCYISASMIIIKSKKSSLMKNMNLGFYINISLYLMKYNLATKYRNKITALQ